MKDLITKATNAKLFITASLLFGLIIYLNPIKATNNSSDANIELGSMDTIKQKLEINISPERETPFHLRAVNTYMDGKWIGDAISYGCYREGQAPGVKGPSEAEILEDLQILQNYWNLIRVYGADEDSERVLKVIEENNIPIKVMLGIWIENETNNPEREKENIKQVLKGIELGNKYEKHIYGINVGNESQVFWSAHRIEMHHLIKYIRNVRNNTNVPVTTADDYNFWNKPESKEVANEVDFIVCHIYPLWNGKTLENSISWMDDVYFNQIKNFHTDKEIVLGEIGWATVYNPDKKGPGEQGTLINGEVSLRAQELFLIELNSWTNNKQVTTFIFEAFDEPWKGGGENTGTNEIEKNWGLFYESREPKESFVNFLKSVNDNNNNNFRKIGN